MKTRFIFIILLFAFEIFSQEKSFSLDWNTYRYEVTMKEEFQLKSKETIENQREFMRLKMESLLPSYLQVQMIRVLLNSDRTIGDEIEMNPGFENLWVEYFNQNRKEVYHDKTIGKYYSVIKNASLLGSSGIISVFPLEYESLPFPEFQKISVPTEYSGLIVDVSDFDFNPSFFPRIQTDKGQDIYSYYFVKKNHAHTKGFVGYHTNLTSAKKDKRVGLNAYYTIPISIAGEYKSNIVITTEDATKFMSHPKTREKLKQCSVVIIYQPPRK